ncbi:MAG: GNAT family N-acetyltransferase, partial [Candidatus Hodarchaeota archaeon]
MQNIILEEIGNENLDQVLEILEDDADFTNYWSKIMGFNLTRGILKEKTMLDIDFEKHLFLGAFNGPDLVGFSMAIRRPWKEGRESQAWIKFIYIIPSNRKKGIGTRLLSEFERRLHDLDVNLVTLGSSAPNYVIPGMPQDRVGEILFLKKNGWEQLSERTNLSIQLSKNQVTQEDINNYLGMNPEYEILLASKENKGEIEDFFILEFSKSWFIEISPAFNKDSREILSILKDRETGKIVGFAATNCTNENWFGPM